MSKTNETENSQGVWLDKKITGYKEDVFLFFNKPLRDINTKIPFRYVGNVSNGSYVFEQLADTLKGNLREIPKDYLKCLENYSNDTPEPFKLYLRERGDGSRYITINNYSYSEGDKMINSVKVCYNEVDGQAEWSLDNI